MRKHIKWTIGVSWICQLIAAHIMFWAGIAKLNAHPGSVHVFDSLGSGDTLRLTIGVLEVFAAALLLMPKTVAWGAVLSFGIMLGAIIAHLTELGMVVNNDGGWLISRLATMLVTTIIIMVIRRRSLPLIGSTFSND